MNQKNKAGENIGRIRKTDRILWGVLGVFALYMGLCLSNVFVHGELSLVRLENLDKILLQPWKLKIEFNKQTGLCVAGALFIWLVAWGTWYSNAVMRLMHGREFGTSEWGNIYQFNRLNTKNCKNGIQNEGNRILSKNLRVSYDMSLTQKNNNQVVIGGSGAGKTAFVLSPNLLNLYGSNVYTDPKGALLKQYGNYLEAHGVEVQSLNLCDMDQSHRYNPFEFIREDADIEKLASNIFLNTAPENYQGGQDPVWDNLATMLLEALMYYIYLECPRIDRAQTTNDVEYIRLGRDFTSLLQLADELEVSEEEGAECAMDFRMRQLEEESSMGARHPAIVRYRRCWKGAADTKRSILITLYSRISRFDNPKLLRILSGNDLDLKEMGMEKRVALFIIIPETDSTYNFLPGILYTQIFQQLFDAARNQPDNRLPIPVGFWLDEFVNIPMPRDFEKILATCRSYNVYISIFLQALAQLKGKYKDDRWEGIIGNADTLIYLGGNEASTYKYISEQLGKWTIDKRSTGETKGSHGSSSRNLDVLGRELMTPDEVRMLSNDKEIILYRSYYPMIDEKMKCWTMPEYQEALRLGSYKVSMEENGSLPSEISGLLACKGDGFKTKKYAIDLLDFLKMDFGDWDDGNPDNRSEEDFLTNMNPVAEKRVVSEERREDAGKEEMDQEKQEELLPLDERIALYKKAKNLWEFVLTPGALTVEQRRIYQKCRKEGMESEWIFRFLNPVLTLKETEQAFEAGRLLFQMKKKEDEDE